MRVSLFATCVVDLFFPEIGESAVRVLRRFGCEVDYPAGQTCCGQPAYNSGHRVEARRMAVAMLDAFDGSEYVVAPSGSCAGMMRVYDPALFADDPVLSARARGLAAKTYEFSEFLVRVLGVNLRALGAGFTGSVSLHAACHTTRELGVREEPGALLDQITGLQRQELERAELCCGFGGTFSVKLPEVAVAMADDKLADVRTTGAQYLVGTDAACLMHLGGRMRRTGGGPEVLHLAQVLDRATRGRRHE